MTYFTLESSPYFKDKYIISIHINDMPFPNGTNGSYAILPARVLNLSYTDYLRYARDRLGAELIGKNQRYVIPYFDYTPAVQQLVELLNRRMRYLMMEQENPYYFTRTEEGVKATPFEEME